MKRGLLIGIGAGIAALVVIASLPYAAWRFLIWILWDPEGDD